MPTKRWMLEKSAINLCHRHVKFATWLFFFLPIFQLDKYVKYACYLIYTNHTKSIGKETVRNRS